MNTSIQIQQERASMGTLATAAVKALLKFLTLQVNILLAFCALISLLAWLATEQHATVAIFAIVAWVGHLAVMLTISIAKGGDQL